MLDRFFRPGRPFYIRLAIAGFLLVPAANAVLGLLITALGDSTPRGVVVLLSVSIIVNTAAGLALRWSDRFLIPCVVVAPFVVLISFGLGSFGLAHPHSFFDFVTSFVIVVGPLIGLTACSVALVQRRRGALRPATPTERRLAWSGVGILLLIAAFSGVLTFQGRESADAPRGAIVVETRTDEFAPSELHARAGEAVKVFLINDDAYAHTFTIDSLALDQYIGPRAQRLVTFRLPRRHQRLELYCAVVGHDGMTGTVVVD